MKTEKGANTFRRLLKAAQPYWLMFVCGIVGTLFLSLVDAGLIKMIQPIINNGLVHRDSSFISWLPAIIIILFIIRGGAGFCSGYYISRVARSVVMDYRRLLFAKYLRLPATYYDTNNSGHMLSTVIYNVEQVANASSSALVSVVRDSSMAVGLLVVMFTLSWQLTLIFLIVAPFISWVVKMSSRRMRSLSKNVQGSVGDVTKLTDEGIQAYKAIRIYGGQQQAYNKFKQASLDNRHQELKIVVTDSISSAVVQIFLGIPLAFSLYYAAQPAMHISAGTFGAMIAAMVALMRPCKRLTQINSTLQKGIAGAESIFKVLDDPEENDQGTRTLVRAQGVVEFQRVGFRYESSDQPVLQDINFKLAAGKILALVGKSGAGKSTLVSLLPRFYQALQGQILIDDVNINDYKLADLRSQLALVSQNVVLFDDTLANNIAYGYPAGGASIEAVRAAAEAACVCEFADQMPDGLDTLIGEDGVRLSGGQRQRVAIARAFMKKAPILILDEATASLDSYSEKQIQLALSRLMAKCTTLVIAHRFSTIEHADHILVLDQGRVIEQGTHVGLLAQQGLYAELYEIQFANAAEMV